MVASNCGVGRDYENCIGEILDARYWMLDTLHFRTRQIIIEYRESSIEYQVARTTRPPVTRDKKPATSIQRPAKCLS